MQFSRKILSDLWTLIWDLESWAVVLESVRAAGFCGIAGHFLLSPWECAAHPGLAGNAGSPQEPEPLTLRGLWGEIPAVGSTSFGKNIT